MTPEQKNSTAALLFHKLNLQAYKANIIGGITFGRTESIRACTDEEKDMLIEYLRIQQQQQKNKDDADNRMRRKIISKAHELHWHIAGTQSADMERVNNWCIKFGPFHKKLNAHNSKELPILVTAFENMYKSIIKSIKI